MAEKLDVHGVLTRCTLVRRLKVGDLVVTPLLDGKSQIGEGSIDISLGTKFITTQRSHVTEIDPRHLDLDSIREFQRATVVGFGQKFTLHPQNLVLGSTSRRRDNGKQPAVASF